MRITHTLTTSLRAIATNKSRSALTILGIVIGITAIILVMAVGTGAQELILGQVRAFGSDTIFIEPGREPRGPADFIEVFTDSLRGEDVAALRQPARVPGVKRVSPSVVQVASIAYGNETYRAQLHGHDEHFTGIFDIVLDRGVGITADDVHRRASVALIGTRVQEDLFGDRDPIGEFIKVKDKRFRVVGTIPAKGQAAFVPYDQLVVIPYTTMQKYILGIDYFHMIVVEAHPGVRVDRVKRDIELTLREQHAIIDPEKDDFHVTSQEDVVERIGIIGTVLTALLTSFAAIALVVGGIGVMNIMLVSVTERTREIGLRKALGATRRDILTQFLFEAVALTVVGGMVGVVSGAMLAFLASWALSRFVTSGWSFTFPFNAAALGIVVAAGIGIIFGIYPARRAAKQSPMEALRYE